MLAVSEAGEDAVKHERLWAGVALALFAGVSVYLTYHAQRLEKSLEERETKKVSALRGQPAPDFTLPALANAPGGAERVALADYRGQVVFVSFWASWCRPCDYELPLLNQFYVNHRDRNIQVIAVSVDSDRAAALAYLEKRQFALPMVWDQGGRVADLYKAEALPTLIVIDPEGRVREVERGVRMDLEAWLDLQVRAHSRKKPAADKKAS